VVSNSDGVLEIPQYGNQTFFERFPVKCGICGMGNLWAIEGLESIKKECLINQKTQPKWLGIGYTLVLS